MPELLHLPAGGTGLFRVSGRRTIQAWGLYPHARFDGRNQPLRVTRLAALPAPVRIVQTLLAILLSATTQVAPAFAQSTKGITRAAEEVQASGQAGEAADTLPQETRHD
jgi:hypothetical protein